MKKNITSSNRFTSLTRNWFPVSIKKFNSCHIIAPIVITLLFPITLSCGAGRSAGLIQESSPHRTTGKKYSFGGGGGRINADYMAKPSDRESDDRPASETASGEELERKERTKISRMVVYNARYRVNVKSIKQSLHTIKNVTKQYKGRIERIDITNSYKYATVVMRVPVARFNDALKEVERLGRVTNRVVSAQDVTKRFSDISLKLKTKKRMRDRLYHLLRRVKKAKEKVRILREIERLSSYIEQMKTQLNYLKDKASMSTITAHLRAITRGTAKTYISSPFGWISRLRPNKRSIFDDGDGITFTAPEGFFPLKDAFFNGSGAKYLLRDPIMSSGFRVGTVPNYPPAKKEFWSKALEIDLKNRMYSYKKDNTRLTNKQLNFNQYKIKLANGAIYIVAVSVSEDTIIVVEGDFKSEKSFSQYGKSFDTFINSVRYGQ